MPTRNTTTSTDSHGLDERCLLAGTELARVRIARGIPVAEVAERLQLAPHQVAALEDGDRHAFHSPSYFMNGLRRYAAFAEIDPGLVTNVAAAMNPSPSTTTASVTRRFPMAAAALLVLSAAVAGTWWSISNTPTPVTTQDAAAPIPTIVFSQDPSSPAPPPTTPAETGNGAVKPAGVPSADAMSGSDAAREFSAARERSTAAAIPPSAAADAQAKGPVPGSTPFAGEVASSASPGSAKTKAASAQSPGDTVVPARPAKVESRTTPQPPLVSGAFGALRVRDATWVLVRDANDSVVGRSLPADGAFPLETAPIYLAVGTPNVDLFVGSRRVDVADYIVNGQVEMRSQDFAALAKPGHGSGDADRR